MLNWFKKKFLSKSKQVAAIEALSDRTKRELDETTLLFMQRLERAKLDVRKKEIDAPN